MRCGAKKRNGEPCNGPAMPNGRCRMHGGKTPRGFALPQTTTGRYSKDLPARLALRYEAAREDAALLELRDEIAVLDARLSDLLQKVDTGEAGALWKRLREHRAALLAARRQGDSAAQAEALTALLAAVERGAQEWMTWQDIQRTIHDRRRVAESERKRLVEAQQMVSVGQLALVLGLIEQTLRKHVSDPDTLAAFARDLRPILGGVLPGQA